MTVYSRREFDCLPAAEDFVRTEIAHWISIGWHPERVSGHVTVENQPRIDETMRHLADHRANRGFIGEVEIEEEL